MHELGITQEIIAIVAEHSKGAKVTRVVLEIGKLSAILPDAVRFCFDLCSEGTVAEGAQPGNHRNPGPSPLPGVRGRSRAGPALRPLRLRRHRPGLALRGRTENQGNGGGLMCATCGCSDDSTPRSPTSRAARRSPWRRRPRTGHHAPRRAHSTTSTTTAPSSRTMPTSRPRPSSTATPRHRPWSWNRTILAKNNRLAERNRGWLAGRNILALNLVSSPGAGKTTLLERTIRDLGQELPLSVIEGDQQTLNDARRIEAAGCRVVQINTGTGCHLDAAMVAAGLAAAGPAARTRWS